MTTTYWLYSLAESMTGTDTLTDNGKFTIDACSGQISVKASDTRISRLRGTGADGDCDRPE